MIIDDWHGCYKKHWKGVLVQGAFVHPAKVAPGLAERIYLHAFEEGWLKPGDQVLDPFGGVAGFGYHAALHGLHFLGVELEERFVKLGNENIDAWRARSGLLPGYGSVRLVQGDSRQLGKVINQAQAAVSSPPFSTPANQPVIGQGTRAELKEKGKLPLERYGDSPGNLGNLVHNEQDFDAALSSPPYADGMGHDTGHPRLDDQLDEHRRVNGCKRTNGYSGTISSPPYADGCAHEGGDTYHLGTGGPHHLTGLAGTISSPPYSEARIGSESGQEQCGRGDQYGATPGQLGAMKPGDFESAIGSPPHGDTPLDYERNGLYEPERGQAYHRHAMEGNGKTYGETPGQLGRMPASGFDQAVSSPPYEASDQNYRAGWERFHKNHEPLWTNDQQREAEYGDTPGQLGNTGGDQFWTAARAIVDQVYSVLRPGGHAIWVVKAYVKDKQRVDFPDQWRQLCEAAGFTTLHEHHALLVEDKGSQFTLDGTLIEKRTEKKSFFRRLAEKKGSPRIDWEVVYCMLKP